MSAHFLVVIPRDPQADLPDTADTVREALAEFAGTAESRVKDYGKLQFIDAGENFERIGCPACNREVTIADWHTWMDADWLGEEGFHLRVHRTPCCGKDVTLNDLTYERPQGFARWCISARNGDRGPLTRDEVAHLETLADLPLKAIAQMY